METVIYPAWAWGIFFVVIAAALVLDLGVANRKAHVPKKSEVFFWSVVWVSLALSFNAFVFFQFGMQKGTEFLTGYIIELSLSVDNLFVFLLIFNYFRVPKKFQHRVLFWGIFTALLLRMAMIFAGAELVERFHWIIYIFGAFLIYTGLKMIKEDEEFHPEKNPVISFITRYVRISKHYEEDRFFTKVDGKTSGTLLLLVLIVVEIVDVIFAVDSIPAIFGITTDRFIVYTSNVFAILGLRTFFFLLANIAEKFHLLKYGLAFVLSFIGLKMLLPLLAEGLIMIIGSESHSAFSGFLHDYTAHKYDRIVTNVSLGVVVFALIFSIVLSLAFPKPGEKESGENPA